ncbi:hypothetical protein SELMODRAFT_404403 [Selaginella moellendorffii]|uniref:Bulb-type lectin domain-containing protein n=1 Tax=Selaginella moellendorffii TaxID=88036 RepID=D8QU11_SELML|nr:hypothetical protein SELMODRAFT_404021 [Selaginella moellendorffii]EFJ36416.1 hypothetical protein SELMODRAFT_404403 [Selaginella moellendorffii]
MVLLVAASILILLMSFDLCHGQPPANRQFGGIFRWRLGFAQLAVEHVEDLMNRLEAFVGRRFRGNFGYFAGRSVGFVVEYANDAYVRVRVWLYSLAFTENSDVCSIAPSRASLPGGDLLDSVGRMIATIRAELLDVGRTQRWFGEVNIVLGYFGIEYQFQETPFNSNPDDRPEGGGGSSGELLGFDRTNFLVHPVSTVVGLGVDPDAGNCWVFATSLVGGSHPQGSTLPEGNSLVSPSREFRLSMEAGCDLVVRRIHSGEIVRRIVRGRDQVCVLSLWKNGVLVVSESRVVILKTKTNYGSKHSYGLAMENDGHARLYMTNLAKQIWSTEHI